MTLSGLHHLLCHSHRLACGRQILSKTRAREFRSKLLVSRKHGFPEQWFPLGAYSCGNTCYRLPSWENCVRQIRATVLAEFRWCADVTTDALLGQSINMRAHASFYHSTQSDGNSAARHLRGCDVWPLR